MTGNGHALHLVPQAVPCPSCPARIGQGCRSKTGTSLAGFHAPRTEAVDRLTPDVKSVLVDLLAELKVAVRHRRPVEVLLQQIRQLTRAPAGV